MSYTRIFGGASGLPTSKAVVITGGSRGLGYALASCFLAAGDRVLLTSRSHDTAQAAAAQLAAEHHAEAHGAACDVRDWAQVNALAQTAVQRLGRIDLWINNAGASQVGKVPIIDTDPAALQAILDTNLLGAMLGAKAALSVMRNQPGGGQVWLVDGNGARGNPTPGNAAYGASKRALAQLLRSLASECRGGGGAVHMFSPGMVATDLLFSAATTPSSRRFINILAEPPAEVAAWLVPRIKAATGNGRYIKYLTPRGVVWRLLTAGRRRNRFLDEAEGKQA